MMGEMDGTVGGKGWDGNWGASSVSAGLGIGERGRRDSWDLG